MTETLARDILRIDPEALELEPLELAAEDFQSPLPVQNYHLVFADDDIGLAVGIWDTTTMQEAFGPYPGDEYITVLDGQFSILDAQGAAVTGHAGQSATFRDGIPVSWKQEGYLRKVYLTLKDPAGTVAKIASAEGGVRIIDPGRDLVADVGPDRVRSEVLFRNDAGTMTVWHRVHPANRTALAATPAHQLIRVLDGMVTLTGAAGAPEVFGPGAHVFLPRGTPCAWQTAEGTSLFAVEVSAK